MSPGMATGIAILGAGLFATEAYVPALKAIGSNAPQVKAVYSRSKQSSRHLAEAIARDLAVEPTVYHDEDPDSILDVLLARSDIIAVIVVLPITIQPDIVKRCLAAGKHVLSEKPVAPDVQKGIDLINTYRSQFSNLVWRVAENYEPEPIHQIAAAAIREGKIGTVNFFRCSVVNYIDQDSKWYKTPWRTDPEYQGGFLLDGGVHTSAILRVVLPQRLTHLTGFSSLNKEYLKPLDTIQVVVKAQNFHGSVEITFASPTKTTVNQGIVVTGSIGWLSLDGKRLVIRRRIKDGDNETEQEEQWELQRTGVEAELTDFFSAINGTESEGYGDPVGALRDVALIEAALNSDGRLIDLESLVGFD